MDCSFNAMMESLVSLKSYEPKLQSYLLHHRYPIIGVNTVWVNEGVRAGRYEAEQVVCLQALLTDLAVMQPVDPWQFIIDKHTYY